MLRSILPLLAITTLMISCSNEPEARKDVKKYTAEQLFNNKAIGGGLLMQMSRRYWFMQIPVVYSTCTRSVLPILP
jgi:hypothetical protein